MIERWCVECGAGIDGGDDRRWPWNLCVSCELRAEAERRESETVDLHCESCGRFTGSVHPPAPPVPVVCLSCHTGNRPHGVQTVTSG